MKIVLINPYELGRQPFGLAQPAAWLKQAGCDVHCCDLSIQKLEAPLFKDAGLVAIYVAMHTATRIALEALPKIKTFAPQADLCIYGLYAPMNADLFRTLGVKTVFGGEFEPGLVSLAKRLMRGDTDAQPETLVCLDKINFVLPDRSGLPPLSKYAKLVLPDGETRTVGFAESTRGCKYFCRHCPVAPVYQGKFRVIAGDIVLEDIRGQVAAGARHVSFGDPDFFNGPGHALKIVRALHAEFPDITYDATIKIEHIVNHPDEIRVLRETGCLFIISAVEAVDDTILDYLDKGHTRADFERALAFTRETGIDLLPTFVAFTPWTTLEGYRELLQAIIDLQLIECVAPVQLSIRLLIPQGSYILKLDNLAGTLSDFDPELLGYRWSSPNPRVDALQRDIQSWVFTAEEQGLDRRTIFQCIWDLAHKASALEAPPLPGDCTGNPGPRLSENWYCCAEPSCEQLTSF
ncbi:MAG: CUAEP/CCAEP-tail radical SAM protein [Gammaproteobacteria bacterium]|nr:CUAEP/CCAEP-tail radical SAM protein [Gammaproteobacteria bacterium]